MSRKLIITVWTLLLLTPLIFADPVMGRWKNVSPEKGGTAPIAARIIGEGDDNYRVQIDISSGNTTQTVEGWAIRRGDVGVLAADFDLGENAGGRCFITAQIANGKMTGNLYHQKDPQHTAIPFQMNKDVSTSPTLGQAPPKGAIVLMNGPNLDAWEIHPSKLSEDGILRIVTKQYYVSKQQFGSHKLHVEFRCPYMPKEHGQARGNSGVYIQGRYEVQVLDSFGDPPADNRCGGIYHIAAPKVCASLPPGEWQTYDITFHAAKFNSKGEKIKNARITVLHNGVLIHDDLELPHPTPGGVSPTEAPTGPLFLQNHGNAVEYRNIWVLPIND